MTRFTGVVCRVRIEVREEAGAIVARSPELRISNHGATEEEAKRNLEGSIKLLFEECAVKGTLGKVLGERGIQHVELGPDELDGVLEVPIPLLALENVPTSAG